MLKKRKGVEIGWGTDLRCVVIREGAIYKSFY